jgi:uncharacterized membrane protein
MIVVLRLVHILLGMLWIGMFAFITFFLTPAVAEAGPDGGKLMAALQRRKVMMILPLMALLTIVSGIWMIFSIYGGMAGMMTSRAGQTFATGGTLAIIAFLIGVIVMRPIMMKIVALQQDPGTDREAIAKLRAKSSVITKLVAVLLFVAVGAMAVARYL